MLSQNAHTHFSRKWFKTHANTVESPGTCTGQKCLASTVLQCSWHVRISVELYDLPLVALCARVAVDNSVVNSASYKWSIWPPLARWIVPEHLASQEWSIELGMNMRQTLPLDLLRHVVRKLRERVGNGFPPQHACIAWMQCMSRMCSTHTLHGCNA